MDNFKTNPFSSFIGVLLILFAGVLLFIPTLYNIPLWGVAIIAVSGILLLFAEDKFISILTLGLSRFVKNSTNDNVRYNIRNDIGGDMPDPDKEEK